MHIANEAPTSREYAGGKENNGGTFTTKPFSLAGGGLMLSINACIRPSMAGGQLKVSLLEEGSSAVTLAAKPISGANGLALVVEWLPSTAGKLQEGVLYKLRFEMHEAALFAFHIGGEKKHDGRVL
jgi:hypothetical protein